MFRKYGTASLVLLVAVAAKAEPKAQIPVLSDQEAEARVFELLADALDLDSLTRLMEQPASKCLDVGPAQELCEWRLSRLDPGWRALARATRTRDRVSLLCVLRSDGVARDPHSCTAHIRRSNRDRWKVQRTAGNKGSLSRRAPLIRKAREQNRKRATAMLNEARTLVELSRLIGEMPSECALRGSERVCLWRTTSHTWGHGTLSVVSGLPNSKKLRLKCTLPANGGPRAHDSCWINVGA